MKQEPVSVVHAEDKALKVLYNPNIKEWESDRVYYVAMSRARDRLFLTVPFLSPLVKRSLRNIPIDIKQV